MVKVTKEDVDKYRELYSQLVRWGASVEQVIDLAAEHMARQEAETNEYREMLLQVLTTKKPAL